MKIPCDIKAPCLDDANPFQNLSAEAPDINHFFAYGSGPGSISNGRTTGPGGVGPTPGGNWSSECHTENGVITCVGTTQEEADLCVARLGQQCTQLPDGGTPGTPTTPSGDPLFPNTLQQCTALCPDGSPFTFQVAAGAFVAESQILADREALSYACRQAQILKVCFGALSNSAACVGTAFSATVTVTGGTGYSFSIVSGTLPPGITLSSSGSTVLLSGTPTTPGNYTFSIRVVNSRGNFMVKSFTIFVLGFTNGPIPNSNISAAFTFTFTSSGGTSPYTFTTSGPLPTGLTLSTAGVLSGTPTIAFSGSFPVQITDASGRTCSKSFSQVVAGKVGWKVCYWDTTVRAAIADGWPATGALPSVLPAWDGIFDLTVDDGFGGHMLYFIGQSISGFKVSADESGPDYPNGDFPNTQCFAQLFWDGAVWRLTFSATTCSAAWGGLGASVNPADPSGVYTMTFSSASAPPATISVVRTITGCCPNTDTTPVPATMLIAQGLPQPARVRMVDFAFVMNALGSCAVCAPATGQPVWDGTYPDKFAPLGTFLGWVTGTSASTPKPLQGNGKILQDPALLPTNVSLSVQYNPGPSFGGEPVPSWFMSIFCLDAVPTRRLLWSGFKDVGATPVGVYFRSPQVGQTADGPGCVTIESY